MVRRRGSAVVRRDARCRRSRGWVRGRKCGRGPSAFFEGTPSCSSVLVPIISRRRCLPEAHRTQPPRTPDARSCNVSARERAGVFPPRSCEGTVQGIAHRVKPEWWVAGRSGRRWISLKKMRMAPCRASIRLPFPTSPGKPGAPRHCDVRGHGVRVVNSPRFPVMRACNQIYDEPLFYLRAAIPLRQIPAYYARAAGVKSCFPRSDNLRFESQPGKIPGTGAPDWPVPFYDPDQDLQDMRKIKLAVENLAVQSFVTSGDELGPRHRGGAPADRARPELRLRVRRLQYGPLHGRLRPHVQPGCLPHRVSAVLLGRHSTTIDR